MTTGKGLSRAATGEDGRAQLPALAAVRAEVREQSD